MIGSGPLRDRVTLRSAAITRGEVGGAIETWSDLATVWARVRPLRGREISQASQIGSAVSLVVEIRWRTDVTPSMQVRFDTGLYAGKQARIGYLEPLGVNEGVAIYCELIDG